MSVYEMAVAMVKAVRSAIDAVGRHDADLARQMRRAAASVVLNIAEGNGSRGGNARQRWATACGSAKEVRAALDVADALGYARVDAGLARQVDAVAAVLYRMSR